MTGVPHHPQYHGDDMRRSALEMNNEVESTQDAKWYRRRIRERRLEGIR